MNKSISISTSFRTLILALGLLILMPACDVTDLSPIANISEATAFENAERAELAVVGVYNAAQSGFFAGGQGRGYPLCAASIQQGDMRGEDMVNQALFYAITNEATYTPFSANNVFMWNTLFGVINQANVVIEGLRGAVTNGFLTAEQGAAFEGECRFLRALSYHELAIHFARPYADNGGNNLCVPIRQTAVNSASTVSDAISQGRNTVAEVYAFILSDLDYCEQSLPATRAGIRKVTRATSGAAIALKARVKQHKGDWPGVIAESNKIVSASAPFTSPIGAFVLNANPEGAFSNNYTNESVFSIENAVTDNPGVNGALPAMLGNPAVGGRGLVLVGPYIYNEPLWLVSDLRRTMLSNNGRSYFTEKYKDKVGRSDAAPILRYAEVLLTLAEAEARQNGLTEKALSLLNEVRNRAVTEPADQYQLADFADANALIAAILMERRIELLAEGRRWADIHRLALDPNFSPGGIPAKVAFAGFAFTDYDPVTQPQPTKGIPFIEYSNFRFLWPIPADELAQNPTLSTQQNPGY